MRPPPAGTAHALGLLIGKFFFPLHEELCPLRPLVFFFGGHNSKDSLSSKFPSLDWFLNRIVSDQR